MSNDLRNSLELRTANIRHYFPDVLVNAVEFKELGKAMDPELNRIIKILVENALNTFVFDLNEYGALRWEKMLKLTPRSTDTIDDRRLAILQKIMASTPYTIRKLQSMFDGGYGVNEIIATEEISKYNLNLMVTEKAFENIQKIKAFTRSIIPANLTISISTQKEVNSTVFISGYCQTITTFELEVENG